MSHRKYFNLNPNVFFAGITSFFTDISVKMVYSVMPLFLLSIGASKTSISAIEGIAESTAALLKAASGFWSDKIGRNKPFMIFGYGLTALITPFYSLVVSPAQVLWLRFIERTGKGVRTAPRDSLISGSVKKGETGKNFGFHKAMDNSGAIIGPLLAFVLLSIFPNNFRFIFLISAIPAIIGVLIIIFYIKEAKNEGASTTRKPSLKNLPRRYWFFLAIVFVFSLGNSTDALLLIKTTETGISDRYIPFIYMIFNAVSVVAAIPIGKLSDRIGRNGLIVAGFLVYSLTYFLFGRFCNIGIFIGLFMMYGMYSALTDSNLRAKISDIISPELKGTGYGLYHATLGISLLPASLIGGWLYDNVNSSVPFYFGSAMALIAAALMVLFSVYPNPANRGECKA